MTTRRARAAVAIVLVAAVPVAAWGLMGQQDHGNLRPSELDYAVRPPDLPAGLDILLGAGALVLAVVCGALLVQATQQGDFAAQRWAVLGPLIAAGAIAAVCWRMMTAGVIGANIGAGFAALLGGPVVAGLLITSAVIGAVQWRSHRA